MKKLKCLYAGAMLPDYWGGHHLPHVSVPVDKNTTFSDIRTAVIAEISAGAIGGNIAENDMTDDWVKYAIQAALDDIQPNDGKTEKPFPDIPAPDENDGDYTMAYFILKTEDD